MTTLIASLRGARTPLLAAGAILLCSTIALSGCLSSDDDDDDDDNGYVDGDDNGDDNTATFKNNDTWLAAGLGIDDGSTWFMYITSTVAGDQMDATLKRISDQGPPEGTEVVVDYTEDENNRLTFTDTGGGFASTGRLNIAGNTYVARDTDLENDDEGSLQVGILGGQGTTEQTLDGDYWVAMVHSDAANYFTGTYDMEFGGNGNLDVTNATNDQDFDDYDGSQSYSIASEGELTVPNEGHELIGAARADGELFHLVETRGSASHPDNSYKTLFVGVEKSTSATNALLEGTWDTVYTCSEYNGEDWDEGAGTMTFDSNGNGTYKEGDDEHDISTDLQTDGTFEAGADYMKGAVTPSGDTMVIAYTKKSTDYDDYCLTVAIKQP